MNTLAARLTSVHTIKHLIQTSRVARFTPTITAYYHQQIMKDDSHQVHRTSSYMDTNNQRRFQFHSDEQSHFNFDYWTHGIIILGVLIGSAVFRAVFVWCEEKKEEKVRCEKKKEEKIIDTRPDSQLEGFSATEVIDLNLERAQNFEEAKQKALTVLMRKFNYVGAPGIVVSVSVDGKTVWSEGLGYADVENAVPCTPQTVMRIASISKSITMTSLAKLWEEGKIDFDAPIQKYVPYFPIKKFEGEEVTITTRHLLCHKSGIRHYSLKNSKQKEKNKDKNLVKSEEGKEKEDNKISNEIGAKSNQDNKAQDNQAESKGDLLQEGPSESTEKEVINKQTKSKEDSSHDESSKSSEKKSKETIDREKKSQEPESSENVDAKLKKRRHTMKQYLSKLDDNKPKKEDRKREFDLSEYYIRETFHNIKDAVQLFMDDDLFFKPGTDFLYTTHGWTLVSAVIEGVAGKPFTHVIKNLFHDLGLSNTYLDEPNKIIFNRGSYYKRDDNGRLLNAPYVDNSYKWAGGGYLSTVEDLAKFGNMMLYASQQTNLQESTAGKGVKRGYLKASTVRQLWTPVSGTKMGWDTDGGYGLGWGAVAEQESYAFCHNVRPYASHTGGAIGASSVLLILPEQNHAANSTPDVKSSPPNITNNPPKGVVVSLITNLENVGLNTEALVIAKLFENASKNMSDHTS